LNERRSSEGGPSKSEARFQRGKVFHDLWSIIAIILTIQRSEQGHAKEVHADRHLYAATSAEGAQATAIHQLPAQLGPGLGARNCPDESLNIGSIFALADDAVGVFVKASHRLDL
jgi:hypothetical protein